MPCAVWFLLTAVLLPTVAVATYVGLCFKECRVTPQSQLMNNQLFYMRRFSVNYKSDTPMTVDQAVCLYANGGVNHATVLVQTGDGQFDE